MPTAAAPTIEMVLDEFLDDQEARLSPATFRKYASTMELAVEPAVRACRRRLPPEPRQEGARIVEDYLTIERTEPGALWFEGGLGPVRVPDEAAELAKPGWGLWGALAFEDGRYRLLEHGIVYP